MATEPGRAAVVVRLLSELALHAASKQQGGRGELAAGIDPAASLALLGDSVTAFLSSTTHPSAVTAGSAANACVAAVNLVRYLVSKHAAQVVSITNGGGGGGSVTVAGTVEGFKAALGATAGWLVSACVATAGRCLSHANDEESALSALAAASSLAEHEASFTVLVAPNLTA